MQEKVYKKRIKDIDELRARIMTALDEMDQRSIDAASSGPYVISFLLFVKIDFSLNLA